VCLLSLIALHSLPTRLHPVRDFVSQYALTPFGRLYSLQAVCSGVAAFSLLAIVVSRGIPVQSWGLICLGLYALSRLLIPIFPMDNHAQVTRTGRIHLLLAATTFLGIAGATVGLTHSLARQPSWNEAGQLLRVARMVTVASALTFLIACFHQTLFKFIGSIERCIYIGALLWLGTLFIAPLFLQ
jgi:hypothetical protein